MNHDDTTSAADECGGCSLHDVIAAPAAVERRAFLRAAGMVLASLGLATLGANDLAAMSATPIGEITGLDGDRPADKRYLLPSADGVSIDRDNSVIIARADGKVYAFALSCPHRNTALRWDARDHEFQCPKHKSRYRADGSFIEGRATRNMDRLAIRRAGAELIVDVDRLFQEDEDPKGWAAAFVPA